MSDEHAAGGGAAPAPTPVAGRAPSPPTWPTSSRRGSSYPRASTWSTPPRSPRKPARPACAEHADREAEFAVAVEERLDQAREHAAAQVAGLETAVEQARAQAARADKNARAAEETAGRRTPNPAGSSRNRTRLTCPRGADVMAFGSTSAIFNCWVHDSMYETALFIGQLSVTTYKAALFNNTGTPDNTAVATSAKYNACVWVTANEVTDATNWLAGGRTIGAPTSPPAAYSALAYVMIDAADTAGGGNVTLANVYGDLVYDDAITTPVADQALAYHSYGGSAQGVTAGTFTVVWHANGVARWVHTPA